MKYIFFLKMLNLDPSFKTSNIPMYQHMHEIIDHTISRPDNPQNGSLLALKTHSGSIHR